jgi:hypothetical protein
MTARLPTTALSRIDKLFLELRSTAPEVARSQRQANGAHLVIGSDVGCSATLQLMVLTTVNLAMKTFGKVTFEGDASLWVAPCLTRVGAAGTLGNALASLGAQCRPATFATIHLPHLVVGDACASASSIRLTFDGWLAAAGPAKELARMAERPLCTLACIAAAALGVGELFSGFAGINLMATRQTVRVSLWDPIGGQATGEAVPELPGQLSVFGLGHLGQAYLWAAAALPYEAAKDLQLWLCDDDVVEEPNLETGALLGSADITKLKTRVAESWLSQRGFETRLFERRIDAAFRAGANDPVIALSGFDDNHPRKWLADAGFQRIFDTGLGGEASNFDTIAFRSWPNARPIEELWPIDGDEMRQARDRRKVQQMMSNRAYDGLATDECGRLLLAGISVAVPFVGAIAACVAMAEMLKCVNGVAYMGDLKLRAGLLGSQGPMGQHAADLPPIRGMRMARAGLKPR